MSNPENPVKMPKWLFWGLVAKGAILVLVVVGVMVFIVAR